MGFCAGEWYESSEGNIRVRDQPVIASPRPNFQWIQDRLAVSAPAAAPGTGAAVAAAVLVPLVDRPAGMTVLLTRRTDTLADHAGQISFPGGRIESSDPTPEAAALRETWEEIGLGAEYIDIAGRLDELLTGTGFHVTPVVGVVEPGFTLTLAGGEVAEAFEVPLGFVLDPASHRRETVTVGGAPRTFDVFEYQDRRIWGATARVLVDLARRLTPVTA